MKNRIKSLIKHPFIQGSFIFTVSNFIISLLNYFFNFLAGRALGPIGYSEITAFFSYTTIFLIPFTIISTLIIQKIGSKDLDRHSFTKSLELWFIKKIEKWWFLVVFLIFIVPFIPRLTNVSLITACLIVATVIIAPFSVFYNSALYGLKLFLAITFINIVTTFIKFSGAVLVTLKIDGLLTIFACLMISTIFNLVTVIWSFKNNIKSQKTVQRIERRIVNTILDKYFFLTATSIISITLLSNFDIIFAKKFFTANEAGFFAAWSLFAKIIFYFVSPFVSLTFVFFSSKKNSQEQDKILIGTFLVLIAIGIGCFILYTLFPTIVEIIFGNKFKFIIQFLPLAAVFGIFYSAINLFNNYFLAKKSLFTLILPLSLPVYIFVLLISRNNLEKIMYIDIFFGLLISIFYLGAFIYQKKFNRSYIISS